MLRPIWQEAARDALAMRATEWRRAAKRAVEEGRDPRDAIVLAEAYERHEAAARTAALQARATMEVAAEAAMLPAYERADRRERALAAGVVAPEQPGPGQYEGNEDALLAQLAHEATMDGVDEEAGDVTERGWIGRVGRFVVLEDDLGFVTVEAYTTEDEARLVFTDYAGAV